MSDTVPEKWVKTVFNNHEINPAYVERLERDAVRFDWLVKRAHRTHDYDRTENDAHWFIGFYADASIRDFRAAIDAAMGEL
jgi:hypothetical protein